MKATYDARTDTLSIILKVEAAVAESDGKGRHSRLRRGGEPGLAGDPGCLQRVTEARRIEFETVG